MTTETSPRQTARGCLVLLVLLALGAAWCFRPAPPRDRAAAPTPEPAPALDIQVRISDVAIELTNPSTVPYTALRVAINPTTFGRGFTREVATLAPGATITLPAATFADGDGRRYNPRERVMQAVTVSALVDGTRRYAGGTTQ